MLKGKSSTTVIIIAVIKNPWKTYHKSIKGMLSTLLCHLSLPKPEVYILMAGVNKSFWSNKAIYVILP